MSNFNAFEYKKLSPDEMQSRGILGRLAGKIAAWKSPTRNGRRYGKDLWQKVFDDPIFQEKINNKCLYGEIQHPSDGREEIDPEKIAICLSETPKIADDGFIYGVFDILNTNCGKILKTMLDYGTTIGVSSRGSGDLITGYDGQEEVDPDSYDLSCWDAVLLPAVRDARLQYVTESFDNKKSLSQSLNSLVESTENESDKKIMLETINNLHLNEEIVDKDVLSQVIEHFGTVDAPYDGPSYILPNGLLLDLRNCDHHADVEKWLIDNGLSDNQYSPNPCSKTLFDLGCIRVDTIKYYIALCEKQPTREQYNSLIVWLDFLQKTTKLVEIITPDGQHVTYNLEEIISEDVEQRIRKYYSSGVLYEQLNQRRSKDFRYNRNTLGEGVSPKALNEDEDLADMTPSEYRALQGDDVDEVDDELEDNVDNAEKHDDTFNNKEIQLDSEPSENPEIGMDDVPVEEQSNLTFKVDYKFPQNDIEFYFISNDCIDKEDAEKRAREEIGDDIEIVRTKEINDIHVNEDMSMNEALIHPEYANKEVTLTVNNALSNTIDKLFGDRIINKEVLNKNEIKYIIPYNSDLEQLGKRMPKIQKAINNSMNENINESLDTVPNTNIPMNDLYKEVDKFGWIRDAVDYIVDKMQKGCGTKATNANELVSEFAFNPNYKDMVKFEKNAMKESFDDTLPMEGYDCYSYYGTDYRGLEDSFTTDDYSAMKDWVWEHYDKGGNIVVSSRATGDQVRISPDDKDENGEYEMDSIDDPGEWLNDKFAVFMDNELNQDKNDAKLSDNTSHKKGDNHIEDAETSIAANNVGADVMEALQESLKEKQQLEKDMIELQEKLSVCYAKEAKDEDSIKNLKESVRKMSAESKKVNVLNDRVSTLSESLQKAEDANVKLNNQVNSLQERLKVEQSQRQNLKEGVNDKALKLKELNEKFTSTNATHRKEVESLNESIAGLKKDLEQVRSNYSQKLEKSNKLVEKYKQVASAAADRYIDSQALRLGVSSNEIKNKLPESYSFDDVDSICESLQSHKINMSRLPFRTSSGLQENVKIGVKSPVAESFIPEDFNDADEVDDMLKSLAGV